MKVLSEEYNLGYRSENEKRDTGIKPACRLLIGLKQLSPRGCYRSLLGIFILPHRIRTSYSQRERDAVPIFTFQPHNVCSDVHCASQTSLFLGFKLQEEESART